MSFLKYLVIYFEKSFNLDFSYFFKNGFWFFLAQLFTISKGLILSVLFANYLDKSIFGAYTLILSILSILLVFSLIGLNSSVIRSTSRGFDGNYFKSLLLSFKWSFFGSFFLFLFYIYSLFFNVIFESNIALFLLFIFPLYAISNYYSFFLNGKKLFKKTLFFRTIVEILTTLSILFSIFFMKDNLLSLIVFTYFFEILIKLYLSIFYVKKYIKNNKFDDESYKFGISTSKSITFTRVLSKIDTLIIPLFLGLESLASYIIISLIPENIRTAVKNYIPLLLPELSTNKNFSNYFLLKLVNFSLILIIIFILFYFFIVKYIFYLLYPKYYDYYFLSAIFSLTLLAIPNFFFEAYYQSKLNKQIINKFNYMTQSFKLLILLFSIQFGLLGIVLAKVLSRFFNLIFYYSYTYFKK
jgi:O-antigen/teichoic acid export membrane protein